MNLISKRIILSNPNKLKRFNEEILKPNKTSRQKSEISLSNIQNMNYEEDKDNDKINLENINYIEKNIFNKKSMKRQSSSFIENHHNISNRKHYYPILINKGNLFGNKLIRNINKIKNIQISIFEQEISMINLLKVKKNKYMENKYQVIKDDQKNTINNKNKILDIIRTQTKSNFNNKYRLKFKSSNKKKRNLIQNYFSLIKRDLKYENKPINSSGRKLYSVKNNTHHPELSFKKNLKKKIDKDILNKINYSQINNIKKKVIFIPILKSSLKGNEFSKTKV